jgi:hypothetical protein
MATPFLDFINTADFQRSLAETRVTQESRNLAVAPKPNTEPLVRRAIRDEAAGMGLAIANRRTRLAENAFKFQKKQAPFAIGIGALDAGVSVLGGFRNLELQKQRGVEARQRQAFRQQHLQEQQRQTKALTDIFSRRTQAANQSVLPRNMDISSPGLPQPLDLL